MNKATIDVLRIALWVALLLVLQTIIPSCKTKKELPEDCLNEDNWHFIDICKSKDTICFETETEGECFDNWEE